VIKILIFLFFVFAFTIALIFLAHITEATDAVAAYTSSRGEGSCPVSGTNCPRVRFWNSSAGGTWGSEINLTNLSSNAVRKNVIKYSPIDEKIVLVALPSDGGPGGYVCTGNCNNVNSWNSTDNITGALWGASSQERRFDIEFETSTGDAILVYAEVNTSESCDLEFLVLDANATSFSGLTGTCINDTTATNDVQYSWVILARNTSNISQQLTLLASDSTNFDIIAWIWNGTAFGNQYELSTSSVLQSREGLAAAYADDNSKSMIAVRAGTVGLVNSSYWNGTVWTSITAFDIDTSDLLDVDWLTLKADPATDDLQGIIIDSGNDLHTYYWNGADWNITSNLDADVDTAVARPADFAWNPSGSTGQLVWETDLNETTLSNITCRPQCTEPEVTISTYDANGTTLALYTNPTDGDTVNILAARQRTNATTVALGSFSWNGTDYTSYSDTVFTQGTGNINEHFTIAFRLVTLTNFTVTLPGNNLTKSAPATNQNRSVASVEFNGSDADAKNINGTIIGNSSANQTLTVSLLQINNTGNVPISIILMLNETPASGVTVFADLDNNPAGGSAINATQENVINASIPVWVTEEIWVWTNYTSFTSSGSVIDLNISSRAA